MDISSFVDHTFLKPAGDKDAVRRLCAEAKKAKFASVCVNPCEVEACARILRTSPVRVCTVIDFPLGQGTNRTRCFEALDAIQAGADELDIVVNQRLLKFAPGRCEAELLQWVRTCRTCRSDVTLKLILECCNLTKKEIALGCRIAKKVGFDFVKTSTGFAAGGATVADVKLMRRTVGPEMGVKAAGGIRDRETALAVIDAGATRIGASAGMKLVKMLLGAAVLWMAAGCLSCDGRAGLPSGFVHVTERVPDAILEVRYHSTYNFVGRRIDGYVAPEAILTEEAAAALRKASDTLKGRGYRIKIYDAYRPQRAVDHFMRWAADRGDAEMKAAFYPELDKSVLFERGYIAAKSSHSRGSTVDLTLVETATGREADMGGAFDYFGRRSHSGFTEGLTSVQIANRRILREAMVAAGFKPLAEEWWHFTLKDEPYPDRYFDFPVRCLTAPQPEDAGTVRRFTQVSLFSTLLCGRYGGVVDLGWVKGRGNLMIATMDRLDGEVMMVDGIVYQVRSDGSVRRPADGETIPYGTIADFRPETTETIGPIASYEDFEAEMNKLFPDENIPLAVHLTGTFRTMRTRSVERQEKDGLGLAEAAKTETRFEMSDTTGDLVGFRLPGYLKGVNAPGWHLHYIDAERKHGGHVLNFTLKGGALKTCTCGQFDIRLPECPAALNGLDLSRDRSEELKRAEAER